MVPRDGEGSVSLCGHQHDLMENISEDVDPVLSLSKRHDECLYSGISTCSCGPFRDHILPPWAIYAVSKVK